MGLFDSQEAENVGDIPAFQGVSPYLDNPQASCQTQSVYLESFILSF